MLRVHANGLLVGLKIDYKSPISPFLLNAYMNDQKLKSANSFIIHSRDFLPMPVHVSPILCMFIPRKNGWTYRYTDSLKSISMLWNIIQCYTTNHELDFYKNNKEWIDKIRIELIKDISSMEEEMFKAVQNNFNTFVKTMETYTIKRINLLETFLYKLFDLSDVVALNMVLTPQEAPHADRLPKDFNFRNVLNHFFETKDAVRNQRMLQSVPDYKETRHFTIDDNLNGGTVYNGYLDERMAREYFSFLQLN